MVNDMRKPIDISRESLGIPDEGKKDKPEKIVQGEVVAKKKPKIQKVAETFFGGDLKDVIKSTVNDVVIPSAKNMIFDTFTQGLSRIMWSDGRQPAGRPNTQHVNYAATSRRNVGRGSFYSSSRPASRGVDDVILSSRDDANMVVSELQRRISNYGMVSISDLYSLVGITGDYTDEAYGWRNLNGVTVQNVGVNQFRINLPRPEEL